MHCEKNYLQTGALKKRDLQFTLGQVSQPLYTYPTNKCRRNLLSACLFWQTIDSDSATKVSMVETKRSKEGLVRKPFVQLEPLLAEAFDREY